MAGWWLRNARFRTFLLLALFLSIPSGQCTRITKVIPNQLQSSTEGTLIIYVEDLPTRWEAFGCVFDFANGEKLVTQAILLEGKYSGVTCSTPHTSDLPPIPPQQHNFTAKLSVQQMSQYEDFYHVGVKDFVIFDCNTYTKCISCVTAPFPCDWCVNKHRCTHDTADNCRNDILVMGLNRLGPSIRMGPNFCPRINATNGSSEILVPYGTQKSIQVKLDNMVQQMIMQSRFSCQFNIEGRVTSSNAQLVENTIYCDSILFKYISPAANITIPFAVAWGEGESKYLDNSDNVHIRVYRCPAMADNCGMCLVVNAKYQCGWCYSSSQCQVREKCDNGMGVWLSGNQTCPNPEIRSFHPTSGPWEGGTDVTIEGINLGKTFEDIHSGVTVAGQFCEPYRHLYMKTRKIVCRLKMYFNPPGSGPVIVKLAEFLAESSKNYSFVDPKIKYISPTAGPMSGGTPSTIYGEYLNASNDVQAFVENIPCRITFKESNRLECRTGSVTRTGRWRVIVKFDQRERVYNPGFSYVDKPIITFAKTKRVNMTSAEETSYALQEENFDLSEDVGPKIAKLVQFTKSSGSIPQCQFVCFTLICSAFFIYAF